jgi:hypothetical protein
MKAVRCVPNALLPVEHAMVTTRYHQVIRAHHGHFFQLRGVRQRAVTMFPCEAARHER